MATPMGHLLTWSTYGTWLHGDERGSVDALTAQFGAPRLEPHAPRQAQERRELTSPPLLLDQPMRELVEGTIREVASFRNWTLPAVRPQTNHVHVVVQTEGRDPDVVVAQFKAWCTRRLRERKLVADSQSVWTEGCSTRYLWNVESLMRATDYVQRFQEGELKLIRDARLRGERLPND